MDDIAAHRLLAEAHSLSAERLRLAYDSTDIVGDLTVSVPPGRITVIVGANACGKSTLIRGLARLMKPRSGTVLLDGEDITRLATKDVAGRLGILPQAPVAPEGITVSDLVSRGRYPHQRWFRPWSREDEDAIARAMVATATIELANRNVDELSGGQRQRVWIAMALAQETDILLLDEPTTYLDMAHQVEVLDLLLDLNRTRSTTIVLVLHDLNQACRYADHLVAMRGGDIVAEGRPEDVVTEALVDEVFSLSSRVIPCPVSGAPMVVPIGRHRSEGVHRSAPALHATP